MVVLSALFGFAGLMGNIYGYQTASNAAVASVAGLDLRPVQLRVSGGGLPRAARRPLGLRRGPHPGDDGWDGGRPALQEVIHI